MILDYRVMKPEERDFSYTQSQEVIENSGCIGHLRIDMGSEGHGFFSSWDDHNETLKTPDFVKAFNDAIESLRYGGMLANRNSLKAFCSEHPDALIEDSYGEYGIRVDGDDYSYMLRLNPKKGNYAAYIYAYDRMMLDDYLEEISGPRLINVLVVEPGMKPYPKEIESGLSSLQKEVGGYIQAVYPFEEPVALICNEEGKLEGLPLNRALLDDYGNVYDIVAGTFLIVGLTEDDFGSLDESLMEKFTERFEKAENFALQSGKILVYPKEATDKWSENSLTIYQMKSSPTTENMLFMSYNYVTKHNYSIDHSKYDKIYTGPMEQGETLEDVYRRFNIEHPDGFTGHSLSVSDVVVIHSHGVDTAYYVDRFGFKEMPDFFKEKELQLNMRSAGVTFEGFKGTWRVEDAIEMEGHAFYLLEHETRRGDIPGIIAEPNGKVVLTNVYDGFDDYTKELMGVALQPVERMPDPTITVDEMRQYGYPWGGMLPMRMDAALHTYENLNLHIYKLYGDDTESEVMNEADLIEHASIGGIFGVEKVVWNHHLEKENALKNTEIQLEDDFNMIDGIINKGEKSTSKEKSSVLDKVKAATKSQPVKSEKIEFNKAIEL